jgi:hypothetical protein
MAMRTSLVLLAVVASCVSSSRNVPANPCNAPRVSVPYVMRDGGEESACVLPCSSDGDCPSQQKCLKVSHIYTPNGKDTVCVKPPEGIF